MSPDPDAADVFPPTRAAALERVDAIQPAAYARSRNALGGAVTRLSPYVTHGLVSLPEVLQAVTVRHPLELQHKLVQEFGWREFFRHVWRHRGDGILQSLHAGPLPDDAYAAEMPRDVVEARTGLAVIDRAVRTLYATGYLHNHARMWLASYVVHLRKVHWRSGADWMLGYLLDGDLASNHLSWQWVAGTGSHKPYLFNAENVARYAPAGWHVAGSVLDRSYDALDEIARSPRSLPPQPTGDGIEPPALTARPAVSVPPQAQTVRDRDVWLVHPWALGDPPADRPAGALTVGWWPADPHAAWPWSPARWAFVTARLQGLAPIVWHGTGAELAAALGEARSVQTVADPQVSRWLPSSVRQRPAPSLFGEEPVACRSFSSWWHRRTRGLHRVADLPGAPAGLAGRAVGG